MIFLPQKEKTLILPITFAYFQCLIIETTNLLLVILTGFVSFDAKSIM